LLYEVSWCGLAFEDGKEIHLYIVGIERNFSLVKADVIIFRKLFVIHEKKYG